MTDLDKKLRNLESLGLFCSARDRCGALEIICVRDQTRSREAPYRLRPKEKAQADRRAGFQRARWTEPLSATFFVASRSSGAEGHHFSPQAQKLAVPGALGNLLCWQSPPHILYGYCVLRERWRLWVAKHTEDPQCRAKGQVAEEGGS